MHRADTKDKKKKGMRRAQSVHHMKAPKGGKLIKFGTRGTAKLSSGKAPTPARSRWRGAFQRIRQSKALFEGSSHDLLGGKHRTLKSKKSVRSMSIDRQLQEEREAFNAKELREQEEREALKAKIRGRARRQSVTRQSKRRSNKRTKEKLRGVDSESFDDLDKSLNDLVDKKV